MLRHANHEQLEAITSTLISLGVRTRVLHDAALISANRDDLCRAFRSDKIPEEHGGAYDLALSRIRQSVPNARLVQWSGKTDEELFLDVYF